VKQLLVAQRPSLRSTGLITLQDPSITSLRDLGEQPHLKILDISGVTLESLDSLQRQPWLTEIIANQSQLSSFLGLSRHPQLQKISLDGTPLSARQDFRIASVLVVGPRLTVINGKPVSKAEREQAKNFPKIARNLLEAGWEIPAEPATESDYRRFAQEAHIQIDGVPFEELPRAKVKPYFAVPAVFIPKTEADEALEAEKLAESRRNQYEQSEESVDEQLTVSIATILKRIQIHVRPGERAREEILQVLTGLVDAVKLLENCADDIVGGEEEMDPTDPEISQLSE
jgi:hypothetical protein